MGPNQTRVDWDKLQVKCVRLFQDENPAFKADRITLQEVRPYAGRYARWSYMYFDDTPVAGGIWSRRPAYTNSLWRIVNLGPTQVHWGVAEVRMFEDVFCNQEVTGGLFTSGSAAAYSTEYGDIKMKDGNLNTEWRADCVTEDTFKTGEVGWYGCASREAYIGLDFSDRDMKINCFQIFQSPADPYAAIVDKPRFTDGFALQRYLGHKWEEEERYWNGLTTYNVPWNDLPTATAPFIGVGALPYHVPGRWETSRPSDNAAWRIINYDFVPMTWEVHEIEFYEDELCRGDSIIGTAVSDVGPSGQEKAALCFDGDASTSTGWQSSCTNPNGACLPNQAWVGIYHRTATPKVTCFRFIQSHYLAHMATAVTLSNWIDGQWNEHSVHRDLGGGTWNRRPSVEWSMWRVLNNEEVPRQWRVLEIRAFNDPLCLEELTGASPIGSGYKYFRDNIENAFDRTVGTGWGADCDPCNETRKWWVGGELYNATPWVSNGTGKHLVQCIQVWQAENFQEQASSVRVDVWGGEDWTVSSITAGGVVTTKGGGIWTRVPAAGMTKWRLRPYYNPNDQRWRIRELELYSDRNCTVRLRLPPEGATEVVMSGNSKELSGMELAEVSTMIEFPEMFSEGVLGFDQDKDTGVVVMHEPSVDLPGWYGIDFRAEPTWVRCIRMQQGSLTPEQAKDVILEFWDGKNWSNIGDVLMVNISSHLEAVVERLNDLSIPLLDSIAEATSSEIAEVPVGEMVSSLIEEGPYTKVKWGSMVGWTKRTNLQIPVKIAKMDGTVLQQTNLPVGATVADLESLIKDLQPTWRAVEFISDDINVVQKTDRVDEYGNLTVHNSLDEPELSLRDRWFKDMGGAGWQRRPAAAGTIWKMENRQFIPEGWAIYEVEFHSDASCKPPNGNTSYRGLRGQPIASGFVPTEDKNGPQNAFDGDLKTAWIAQCAEIIKALVPENVPLDPVGCHSGAAWIGLDFWLEPQEVRCIRIHQVGYENMQSGSVAMSRWDGNTWQEAWTAEGLGGSAWDQRPAQPNSMWRVVNVRKRAEKCKGEANRIFNRIWGVSELTFFSDDECSQKVEGGLPITSGTIEKYRQTIYDTDNYSVTAAFDGDTDYEWGGNCKIGWTGEQNQSRTNCEGAWVGLDFASRSVEVRCMKIMQSRRMSSVCCDAADQIRLDRWNGSMWVEASWRHVPRKGSSEEPRYLGADFVNMGECPKDSFAGSSQEVRIWEQRSRRDADSCRVPLTGAVVLLGDAACIEHMRCTDAFGGAGQCCPVEGAYSRCCCNFLNGENLFEDEKEDIGLRRILRMEYAMILLSDIVPWIGVGAAFIFYFAGLLLPASAQRCVEDWRDYPSAGCCCKRCCCGWRCRNFLTIWILPFLIWRTYLDKDYAFSWLARWINRPNGGWPRGAQWIRLLLFLMIGFWAGGIAPWAAFGSLLGQGCLFCLFMVGLIIRLSKSKFRVRDPVEGEWDLHLRYEVSGEHLKTEDCMSHAVDIAREFLGVWIQTVVFFLKFIFDLLVSRAQLISYGAIPSIEADRVVDIFPGITAMLQEPGMVIYNLMYWASQVMGIVIGFFVGIPGCEGSCVLIGSVALVMVLVTLTKFLNYDFFGLFAAARQCVKSTRPACQRLLFQGLIMAAMSLTFGTIQCAMVLFSRALKVANPFREAAWACEWNDFMALLMGRALILISAVVGLVLFFLCANGHFMGQDYIVKPVARFLDMDLDALDPDGGGPDGGLFQCSVFLSIVPTVGGVWMDWWNVKGFLVQERAEVYAEEMHDPQQCIACGGYHVKYNNIMTATGRQISLACQILPFGILIGKASEYLNDPPLVYIGHRLKCCCLKPSYLEQRPNLGKGKLELKSLLALADCLTLIMEYGLPLFRRLVSILLYAFMLVGVFGITESNLIEMGATVISAAFYLAFLKGCGEAFFETVVSWLISLIWNYIKHYGNQIESDVAVARTVAGQIGCGAVVSSVVVICAPLRGWTSESGGVIVGALAGLGISYMTLLCNYYLEHPPLHPEDPPLRSAGPTIIKFVFSMCIAALTTFFTMDALYMRSVIACCVFTIGMEMLVMKLILVEVKTVVSMNEFEGVYKPKEGEIAPEDDAPERTLSSPTWTVLTTKRMIPGPCGIVAGAYMGLGFSKIVGHFTNSSFGAFPSLLFGTPSGIIVGLAINSIMDRPPLVACLFSGTFTYLGVAMWNNLVGVVVGCSVGVMVGSAVEEYGLPRGRFVGVREKFRFDETDRVLKKKAKEDAEKAHHEEELRRLDHEGGRDRKLDEAIAKASIQLQLEDVPDTKKDDMTEQLLAISNGLHSKLDTAHGITASGNEAQKALADANHPKHDSVVEKQAVAAPKVSKVAKLEDQVLRGSAQGDGVPQVAGHPQELMPIEDQPMIAVHSPKDSARSAKPVMDSRFASKNTGGVGSRAPSKQRQPERIHSNVIVDGFSLEPSGGLFGSVDGSNPSSPSVRPEQQLALVNAASNANPRPAPKHVIEHPELDDEMQIPDSDLMGRWEMREAPCDSLKPGAEATDAWRQNPTIPAYIPPGSHSNSLWATRQASAPLKPSLRSAHETLVRKPKPASIPAAPHGAHHGTRSHHASSHGSHSPSRRGHSKPGTKESNAAASRSGSLRR